MIIDYCCNEKMEYVVGNKDVNATWRVSNMCSIVSIVHSVTY